MFRVTPLGYLPLRGGGVTTLYPSDTVGRLVIYYQFFLAYAILVLVALYLSLSLPARRGRPGMAHAPALTEAILEYGV